MMEIEVEMVMTIAATEEISAENIINNQQMKLVSPLEKRIDEVDSQKNESNIKAASDTFVI
jgi:hypothetical protein